MDSFLFYLALKIKTVLQIGYIIIYVCHLDLPDIYAPEKHEAKRDSKMTSKMKIFIKFIIAAK